jgi:hypothetical protein
MTFDVKRIGMFIICLYKIFQVASSNGSSSIAIKRKAKHTFRATVMLFFTFYGNVEL